MEEESRRFTLEFSIQKKMNNFFISVISMKKLDQTKKSRDSH